MTVPIKIVAIGPAKDTRRWVGRGYKEMHILEEFLSFKKLPTGERKVSPHDGVFIKCTVTYGLRVLEIRAGVGGEREEWYDRACLCNCNFSVGFVQSICDDLVEASTAYNVLVCAKDRYVLRRNVLASDFTPYVPGQKVLLVPYLRMAYLCCQNEHPSAALRNSATGCRPKDDHRIDTDSDDWRTVYRIIPWCAFVLPRFIKVRKQSASKMV